MRSERDEGDTPQSHTNLQATAFNHDTLPRLSPQENRIRRKNTHKHKHTTSLGDILRTSYEECQVLGPVHEEARRNPSLLRASVPHQQGIQRPRQQSHPPPTRPPNRRPRPRPRQPVQVREVLVVAVVVPTAYNFVLRVLLTLMMQQNRRGLTRQLHRVISK